MLSRLVLLSCPHEAKSDTSSISSTRLQLAPGEGLATFNYSYFVEADLSVAQVYDILSIYGAGSATYLVPGLKFSAGVDRNLVPEARPFTDYPNYRCESAASCAYKFQYICIGDNCGH